jgi:hypothetical protein
VWSGYRDFRYTSAGTNERISRDSDSKKGALCALFVFILITYYRHIFQGKAPSLQYEKALVAS